MQNAIKLENISNLITSPPNHQCRKTTVNMKVSVFCYSWPTHINGMYVCVLGITKVNFQNKWNKKYLVTRIIRIKRIFPEVYKSLLKARKQKGFW